VCFPPSRFTGKERDSESGNDYFGARYFGSSTGRFLSPDPSQLYFADPTNPQSLNLYSYVRNNPLINIDPTGMSCDSSNPDNDESCEDNQDNQYDSSMYSQQMYSQQMSNPPQVVPDTNNPGGYTMKVNAFGTPLDGCDMGDPLCRMEYQEIMAWLAQLTLPSECVSLNRPGFED
jgi:RHS repeat-associated protein